MGQTAMSCKENSNVTWETTRQKQIKTVVANERMTKWAT